MKPASSIQFLLLLISALLLPGSMAEGGASQIQMAPPPAPPEIVQEESGEPGLERQSVGKTVYSIGNPTPEEQFFLELINRARTNATEEAIRYITTTHPLIIAAIGQFGVNTNVMLQQFSTNPPAQPLAFNAALTAAARAHTMDMFTNQFQGHVSVNGNTLSTRVVNAGYAGFSRLGENVYAFARDVEHGHAGFEVDWGSAQNGAVDGMQSPPGHRNSIHNVNFREIGIGVHLGSNPHPTPTKNVGPLLVTQDFGAKQSNTPFITGVAYYDRNGNNFYDPGEGIGGVNVEVEGSAFYAITTASGGYTVPITTNGSYLVTFSGAGFSSVQRSVSVSNLQNVKVDFIPTLQVASISGSATPSIGQANPYQIRLIGGATEYDWLAYENMALESEGAENGLANVDTNVVAAPGVQVIATDYKASGNASFYLYHLNPGAVPQTITFQDEFLLSANSQVTFQSMLRFALEAQVARMEIQRDEGKPWETVWSLQGNNIWANSTFQQQRPPPAFTNMVVDLSAFAGELVKIRFNYDLGTGNYFGLQQNIFEIGWHIDDITFSNIKKFNAHSGGTTTSNSFSFIPSIDQEYVLKARPVVGPHVYGFGPLLTVNSQPAPPTVRIDSIAALNGNEIELVFDLGSGSVNDLLIETTANLSQGWTTLSGTPRSVGSNRFRLVVSGPNGEGAAFFRISLQ
ncbi:MAG: carboxypeptidase regulatory-like domain-containing protein [Verrucomicrobiota bacterium]|nr:carboxypeptidase regulatory-like domain-containing protein [Verrucomicrobiota bacterium]